MCGIIARFGESKSPLETLKRLKSLEYRGYDSYGFSIFLHNNQTVYKKDIGVINLQEYDYLEEHNSFIEIGHTRWATHGRVSQENAHPHTCLNKEFFVVMNGIIENVEQIKNTYLQNYTFNSQTDTEVLVALSHYFRSRDANHSLHEIAKNINSILKGEFSYVLIRSKECVVFKNVNPLILGLNEKEECIICSDYSIIEQSCTHMYSMRDMDLCYFVKASEKEFAIKIENQEERISKVSSFQELINNTIFTQCNLYYTSQGYQVSNRYRQALLDSFSFNYHMQKEIFEQINISCLLTQHNFTSTHQIIQLAHSAHQVIFIAAGSSYYSALFMHTTLLQHNILSHIIIASESEQYIQSISDALIITISQSGETGDCITPLKELLKDSTNTLATITNTPNSTLDRLAQYSIYLNCGIERAVASTKAFMHQIGVSFIVDMMLYESNQNTYQYSDSSTYQQVFDQLSKYTEKYLSTQTKTIFQHAQKITKHNNVFFIGKSHFFPLAMEGALKLKEISYINATGFASGELKHGSLALIEKETPVIMLSDCSLTNAVECETRGATIFKAHKTNLLHSQIGVEHKYIDVINSILYIQLLAFYCATLRGNNPDKPRNLAKSVTVR